MSGLAPDTDELVALGRISGIHGVRGWVKVFSYTDPRDNVLGYRYWWLTRGGDRHRFAVVDGRSQGKTIIAALESVTDRDEAARWVGAEIAVERGCLPDPGEGRYYWADLIGLEVRDEGGERLGRIAGMLETGAHDVMVVEDEGREDILIPFVIGETVKTVLAGEGRVVVDWDWR